MNDGSARWHPVGSYGEGHCRNLSVAQAVTRRYFRIFAPDPPSRLSDPAPPTPTPVPRSVPPTAMVP
jgi:hypothetical protein